MSMHHRQPERQNHRTRHDSGRQARIRRQADRDARRSEHRLLAIQRNRARWQRRWARWSQAFPRFVPLNLSWFGALAATIAGVVQGLSRTASRNGQMLARLATAPTRKPGGSTQRLAIAGGQSLQLEQLEERRVLSATYWVNDNWFDVNGGSLVAGDSVDGSNDGEGAIVETYGTTAFSSLSDALAVAADGDTINVLRGTYVESSLPTVTQDVDIAAYNPGEVDVDVNGAATGVTIAASADASISGINLTNYAATGIEVQGSLDLSGSTLDGGFTGINVSGTLTMSTTVVQNAGIFDVQVGGSGAQAIISSSEMLNAGTAGLIVSAGNATVTGSKVSGNYKGVLVSSSGMASVTGSDLSGNTTRGLENATASVVNASGNWWGSAVESVVNSSRLGPVDFSPYLATNTDLDLGAVGFAPDDSHIYVTSLGNQSGAVSRVQEGVDVVTSGGTIDVLNGTYLASNTVVDKPVTITGQSEAGVKIAPAAYDGHDDSNYSGSAQQGFLIESPDVTIENLTIDGNANAALTAHAQNYRNAILADTDNGWSGGNLTVNQVTIKNIFRKGVGLYSNGGVTTGNVVSNSTFDSIGTDPALGFEHSFAIASFSSSGEFFGNAITHFSGGIGSNYLDGNPAHGPLLSVHDNAISLPATGTGHPTVGLDMSGLADGSELYANSIDMTGGYAGGDMAIVVQYCASRRRRHGARPYEHRRRWQRHRHLPVLQQRFGPSGVG